MMQDLMKTLPDDRPITGLCVVEEHANCPDGYQIVDRTFDQDIDADLWKDGFFSKRITRYICLSKSLQVSDEIVEDISVVGEKDPIPDGFTLLAYTKDTEQKAMRKRQLCLKVTRRDVAKQALTDVIVLSRTRRPPPSFLLAGEINNMLLCVKMIILTSEKKKQFLQMNHNGVNPISTVPNFNQYTPNPFPAQLNSATLPLPSVLDGIPFEMNSKYKNLFCLSVFVMPTIPVKQPHEIESQYSYNFSIERQAQEVEPNCDGNG